MTRAAAIARAVARPRRAIVVLAALGGTAHAGGFITPPNGWTSETKNTTRAEVFVPPDKTAGIELVVSHIETKVGLDARAAAVRAAIDDLHALSRRAALSGSKVTEDGWQERADASAKTAEATLTFRDPSSQLLETARIVIAGDAAHVVAVTGECIARDDAKPAVIDACKAALASLDPGIAAKDRLALAIAPPDTGISVAGAAGSGTGAGTPDGAGSLVPQAPPGPNAGPGPSMSVPRAPMAPISVPDDSAPQADRRPIFVGAGIVLLAALFWWNMRRRARLEADDNEDSQ